MGIFGTAHEWGTKNAHLPKICDTYPTIIKLGTVIPYLEKIQKVYESRDTHMFSLENSKFCFAKKYRYRLYFNA